MSKVKEFASALEKVMPVEELRFKPTPGFGEYAQFLSHSMAHPAKFNLNLVEFLLKTHTREGETVLDPMAGTGSLGVLAALHGRNAVQVELEKPFYGWMEEARLKVEKHGSLTEKGEIRNILGDARQLSKLLVEADAVITSPPYSGSVTGGNNVERREERLREAGLDPKNYISGEARNLEQDWKYGESKGQIGNLKHGEIAAVITSPPYADSRKQPSKIDLEHEVSSMETDTRQDTKNRHTPGRVKAIESLLSGYGDSKENIGNLKHGDIDAVITSPPYGPSSEGGGIFRKGYMRVKDGKIVSDPNLPFRHGRPVSDNPENIDNLPYVDAVITSPPYESSVSDNKEGPLAGGDEKGYGRWREGTAKKHSYTQHDEPCKVDAVITSPPYSSSPMGGGLNTKPPKNSSQQHGRSPSSPSQIGAGRYNADNPQNIGNLPLGKVDAVITSPPYESSLEGSTRHTKGGIASRDPKMAQSGTYATTLSEATKQGVPVCYSPNQDNIGNMKKETYLEAMLQVYSEIYKVLKRKGLAIIVIKPFIRKKEVVDLPYHTWLLLQRVGFKLYKLYKLRLKNESFWRINYSQQCDHSKSKKGCKIHGQCEFTSKTRNQCSDYLPRSQVLKGGVIKHEYVIVAVRED